MHTNLPLSLWFSDLFVLVFCLFGLVFAPFFDLTFGFRFVLFTFFNKTCRERRPRCRIQRSAKPQAGHDNTHTHEEAGFRISPSPGLAVPDTIAEKFVEFCQGSCVSAIYFPPNNWICTMKRAVLSLLTGKALDWASAVWDSNPQVCRFPQQTHQESVSISNGW